MRQVTTLELTTCSIKITHQTQPEHLKSQLVHALKHQSINAIDIDIKASPSNLRSLSFLGQMLTKALQTRSARERWNIQTFKLNLDACCDEDNDSLLDAAGEFCENLLSSMMILLSSGLASELKQLSTLDINYVIPEELFEYTNSIDEADIDHSLPTLETSFVNFFASIPNKNHLLELNLDGIPLGQRMTQPFIQALHHCTSLKSLSVCALFMSPPLLQDISSFIGNNPSITSVSATRSSTDFNFLIKLLRNAELRKLSFTSSRIGDYDDDDTISDKKIREQLIELGAAIENHPQLETLILNDIDFDASNPFDFEESGKSKPKTKMFLFDHLTKPILRNRTINELSYNDIEYEFLKEKYLGRLLEPIRHNAYLMSLVSGCGTNAKHEEDDSRVKADEHDFFINSRPAVLIGLEKIMRPFIFDLNTTLSLDFRAEFMAQFIRLIQKKEANGKTKNFYAAVAINTRDINLEIASYLNQEDENAIYQVTGGIFFRKSKELINDSIREEPPTKCPRIG